MGTWILALISEEQKKQKRICCKFHVICCSRPRFKSCLLCKNCLKIVKWIILRDIFSKYRVSLMRAVHSPKKVNKISCLHSK